MAPGRGKKSKARHAPFEAPKHPVDGGVNVTHQHLHTDLYKVSIQITTNYYMSNFITTLIYMQFQVWRGAGGGANKLL